MQPWTDERLDDLAQRMDSGFARLDQDRRSINARIDSRFDAVDARFDAINRRMDSRFDTTDARFDTMDERFDSMQRTMVQVAVAMMSAFIAGFAGLVALISAQG